MPKFIPETHILSRTRTHSHTHTKRESTAKTNQLNQAFCLCTKIKNNYVHGGDFMQTSEHKGKNTLSPDWVISIRGCFTSFSLHI